MNDGVSRESNLSLLKNIFGVAERRKECKSTVRERNDLSQQQQYVGTQQEDGKLVDYLTEEKEEDEFRGVGCWRDNKRKAKSTLS